jgi:hypothetical protein
MDKLLPSTGHTYTIRMVKYFIAKEVAVVVTAQSRVVLEQLADTELVKKSSSFTEPEGSYRIQKSQQLILIYFVYGLFEDAVGGSNFVMSNDRTIRE